MKWFEISIFTTNEAIEPISHILHESGVSGIAIEDRADLIRKRESMYGEIYELNPNDYPPEGVIIKAYLPETNDLQQMIAKIQRDIDKLVNFQIDVGKNRVTVSEVDEADWANEWKKYYHPVKVSESFTIVPTWEQYEQGEDELIIELDPGMAFGTGTHPTTAMCIRALEKTVQLNDTVIDVGTGSGVLSIAAALKGAKKVTALDLDDVAVTAATQNVALNNVAHIVSVQQNDLLQGFSKKVDGIVANILAEVIVTLMEDAAKLIKQGGYFITSGIIQEKKDIVTEQLIASGFAIEQTISEKDWVTIIARQCE